MFLDSDTQTYLHMHQLNLACDSFLDHLKHEQTEARFWSLYCTGEQILVDPFHYHLNGINKDQLDSDSFYLIHADKYFKTVELIDSKTRAIDLISLAKEDQQY